MESHAGLAAEDRNVLDQSLGLNYLEPILSDWFQAFDAVGAGFLRHGPELKHHCLGCQVLFLVLKRIFLVAFCKTRYYRW